MRFSHFNDHFLTVSCLRHLEKEYADQCLMAKAGKVIYQHILAMIRPSFDALSSKQPVLFFIGKGNNGGDGLVAATHLLENDIPIQVWLDHLPEHSPIDAKRSWQNFMDAGGICISELPSPNNRFTLIVDALFGIGYQADQPIRSPYREAIQCINYLHQQQSIPVLSVDIPSGLDARNGLVYQALQSDTDKHEAVYANATLSLIANKPGFFMTQGPAHCGALYTNTLELDDALQDIKSFDGTLNSPACWQASLIKRSSNFHKGMAGDVVLVGGRAPLMGAGQLAAESALAIGCGRIFWPEGHTHHPGIITGMMRDNTHDRHDNNSRRHSTTCWLIGPGLGVDTIAKKWLQEKLQYAINHQHTVILDADAINILAKSPELQQQIIERKGGYFVMTPHPLEASRLLGCTVDAIQQDRLGVAQQAMQKFSTVFILKGCGTVIAASHMDSFKPINATATQPMRLWIQPGSAQALATGGSGDVLAGALAALIAQGMPIEQAALTAVDIHLRAGQWLEHKQGKLTAHELIPVMQKLLRGFSIHHPTIGNSLPLQ